MEITPDHVLSCCHPCWNSNVGTDMETIISTCWAMVTMVISHEERLNLKVYHLTFTNKLSNVETSQCHDTCCVLLSIFANTTLYLKVKFTDKCANDLTTHTNILALATENQYLTMVIKCNPPHMMLWAGMTATHVIGPCSLVETLTLYLKPEMS